MQILVVDDHALVREGLCQVLKGLDEQIEVLEAPHCARAFELAEQHHGLDLVLLDYHLPDMNGLEALAIFGKKHPELPIVMLSGSVNPQIMRQVMAQGAAGFITKSGKSQELLAILRRVLDGEIYMPTDLIAQAGQPPIEDASTGYLPLQFTRRQEEVLYLLMEGRSNKDISDALNISDETIKTHITAILRGFGVKSRVQAVLAAGRHGYTKPVTES